MERSRWLALTVLCAATMMIILDGTIVTVALPTIQRDLGFSSSGLAWVVNAYLIAFGGLLLLAGRLGDLVGGKRIRSRNVWGANAVQALTVAAAFGFQVLIPQYMQRVLGYGAAGAGTGMLPAAVVIGALSVGVSARLIARFGPRGLLVAGLAPIVAGFALLTRLPVAGSYPRDLLPTMLLIGGFGLAFPAMITLAMSGAADSDAGVASGLVNTTQQAGAAFGVAALSTLAAAWTGHLLAAGHPAAQALTGGYHVAFGTAAGLAAAALVLAAVVLRPAVASGPRRFRSPWSRTGPVSRPGSRPRYDAKNGRPAPASRPN